MKRIYLDNAATTKVDDRVLKAMLPFLKESYGNPSSKHSLGKNALNAVEKARNFIAKSIGAKTNEIIFTSGGTEANNLALKGVFFNSDKKEIIISNIEHESIVSCCDFLRTQGAKIITVPVNSEGLLDLRVFERSINSNTLLVSIIHGNNEIGVVQDLEKIGEICKRKGVLFHVDACQSFLRETINVQKMNIDLLTLNSHKIHGPKGVGALYVRNGTNMKVLIHGGGQEFGMRSGTENVPGIVGFGKAVEIFNSKYNKKVEQLLGKLIDGLLKIPETKLNGSRNERLCNNINIAFYGVDSEVLQSMLDAKSICVSAGSACSSLRDKRSYVLEALGDNKAVGSSIRFSLSRETTTKEIDSVIKCVSDIVYLLRKNTQIIK